MPGTPGLPKPVAMTGEASAMIKPPGVVRCAYYRAFSGRGASDGFAARIRVKGAITRRCLSR
jgi:hypothetical protein